MANIKELSDGNPDGSRLGQSATDLIGFHGKAPSDQRAFTADISTSAPIQVSPYGFSTTQAAAIISLVNELKALLVEKGLMAAS